MSDVANLIKKQETEATKQEAAKEQTTQPNRQEQALERLLAASEFLFNHKLLSDKEIVTLDNCVHQARKGLAKKNGLTQREAVFLRGIFTLIVVIKRLLLRVPKRKK